MDDYYEYEPEPEEIDDYQEEAEEVLFRFIKKNQDRVFYSRQLEIFHEKKYFHWITNRAVRILEDAGIIKAEERKLKTGGRIKVIWNKKYRYYMRAAAKICSLVEEFADPKIGVAIGEHAEHLVVGVFSRSQFIMRGEHTREFGGKKWTETDHDLDFIFERDTVPYGIEVKNKLGYMDYDELKIKLKMCKFLGLKPLIVARMLPQHWIYEIYRKGGYAMIMKYQLYPKVLQDLVDRIKEELDLPVDTPRAIEQGTMDRFVNFHLKNM